MTLRTLEREKGGRKMGLKFAAMNGSGGCYIREQRIRKGYINFMFGVCVQVRVGVRCMQK